MDPITFPDVFEGLNEHAARFGVCVKTILRWCDQVDGLPYTKPGGRSTKRLFNPAWSRQWLEARKVQRNPSQPARRRAA